MGLRGGQKQRLAIGLRNPTMPVLGFLVIRLFVILMYVIIGEATPVFDPILVLEASNAKKKKYDRHQSQVEPRRLLTSWRNSRRAGGYDLDARPVFELGHERDEA